ncbi:MAG: hypothetical protein AAF414_15365 [Pseudomonadota bacterium]
MNGFFGRIGLIVEALLVGASEDPDACDADSWMSEQTAEDGATPAYSGPNTASLAQDGTPEENDTGPVRH